MEHKIEANPDYSILSVKVPAGEKLMVEASSMASMSSNMQMKTKLAGGFSRFLTQESIFINEFTAGESREAEISIAPGLNGDIQHHVLNGNEKFYLTGSCFLASESSVTYNTKFQGLAKGFFSGENFFLMEMSGVGSLWFNYYGGIFSVDVVGEYVVDTGHIVAFTEGLDYSISRIGGYKSLFFSGEGFVCKFTGQGKVWIQTKNSMALVSWADSFRRIEKKSKVNFD